MLGWICIDWGTAGLKKNIGVDGGICCAVFGETGDNLLYLFM